MKITEYRVIKSSSDGMLNKKAGELISNGFQPFGSVSIAFPDEKENHLTLAQAFVKYEES